MDAGGRLSIGRYRTIAQELLAWAVGRRRLVAVNGGSMTPTLTHGDLLLVDIRRHRSIEVGQVVVLHDPGRPEKLLVKRVASRGDRRLAVLSDNPLEARDSRQFGSIPETSVLGPATLSFSNAGALRVIADCAP